MSVSSRTSTCERWESRSSKAGCSDEDDPADAQGPCGHQQDAWRSVIGQAKTRSASKVRISWDDRTDEVIGVVGDIRHSGLDVESRAMIYWPFARNNYGTMTVAVRTPGRSATAPHRLLSASCAQLDPQLVVANIKTMDEIVSDSVAQRRLTMLMLRSLPAWRCCSPPSASTA